MVRPTGKLILYTTNCPRCQLLKERLTQAGMEYAVVDDIDVILNKGIAEVPVLEIEDGRLLSFGDSIRYIGGVAK